MQQHKAATGREPSKFTLVVEWKPEYILPNKQTGELKAGWTYRSDKENEDYKSSHNGKNFKREVDALGYVFNINSHKFKRARLFDNRSQNSLLAEWIDGKLHFPYTHEIEKRVRLAAWLKDIL